MRQFTETYRIMLSKEEKAKLTLLRKYRIVPTKFVREAIEEKLSRELPMLKIKSETPYIPF